MNQKRFRRGIRTVGLAVMAGIVFLFSTQPAVRARRLDPPKLTSASRDPRLLGSYRFEKAHWIYVHLQGSPSDIGFQHGYLLAPEIEHAFNAIKLNIEHGSGHPWQFFRDAARNMLWPKIEPEYQKELDGIVAGLRAHGVENIDLDDIVVLNAFEELPDYYVPWYDSRHKMANHIKPSGHCSAFVATGDWTRGGQIVMAHSAWTSYLEGEHWRIIFDIQPTHGYRFLMDGFPGVITSDDDFGVNSAGLMITETTITGFKGWNPNGIPEFERSRKAMQYASTIDQYVHIMVTGNNGGYANDWLLGDRKTGQIARFELGLKHWRLWTKKNGYFVSANFPSDPEVMKDETDFNPNDFSNSPNARHVRWLQLMKDDKGKIDTTLAEKFLADHYDTYLKKWRPDARTLDGHVDLSSHGAPYWEWGPNFPGGAIQGKVIDSQMAKAMMFFARRGHPDGMNFYVKPFLKAHPQYAWQAPVLRNMIAGPWTLFRIGQHP